MGGPRGHHLQLFNFPSRLNLKPKGEIEETTFGFENIDPREESVTVDLQDCQMSSRKSKNFVLTVAPPCQQREREKGGPMALDKEDYSTIND